MKINDEIIKKIEDIFGFCLYEWQKAYLEEKNGYSFNTGRATGKTFIYCLKLLISDGEEITRNDLMKWYVDERHGANYPKWFANYCMEINQKLIDNGIKTRLKIK